MSRVKTDTRPVATAMSRLWQSVQAPDEGESVVDWIISNMRLAGCPYGFEPFPEHVQIANDLHPRQIIKKPSQRGYTQLGFTKLIAIAAKAHFDRFGRQQMKRADVIYSLPTDPIMKRVSGDRMDRAISDSPNLELLSASSVHLKELIRGSIHCMHRGSLTNTLSIPAEVVAIDEVDQGNMLIAANLDSRLQQASLFGNEDLPGLMIRWGNPVTFLGMAATLFRVSDQHHFHIRCDRCNHWQEITYPDSIAHFYEPDQVPDPNHEVYWMCLKCKAPLSFANLRWRRSDPNRVEGGEWVAKYPDRTADGGGMRGYQAPMAGHRVGGGTVTAKSFLLARDEGSYKGNLGLFLSHKCGWEYADPSKHLTAEALRGLMLNEHARWGENQRSSVSVIGADQGAYIIGLGLVPGSKKAVSEFGTWDVWMIEQVPDTAAFDAVEDVGDGTGAGRAVDGRFTRLIRTLRPQYLCVDGVPNASNAETLFKRHPHVVWRTTYGTVSEGPALKKMQQEIGQEIEHCRVDPDAAQRIFLVDKVKTLDWLFGLIRARQIRLPTAFDASAKVEELMAHICSVEKVVRIGDRGKVIVYYQSVGADHLLMALMNAALAALVVYNRRARYRGHSIVIDPTSTIRKFKSGLRAGTGVT